MQFVFECDGYLSICEVLIKPYQIIIVVNLKEMLSYYDRSAPPPPPPPPPILVRTSDMCYVTIFDDFRNLLLNSQKVIFFAFS